MERKKRMRIMAMIKMRRKRSRWRGGDESNKKKNIEGTREGKEEGGKSVERNGSGKEEEDI